MDMSTQEVGTIRDSYMQTRDEVEGSPNPSSVYNQAVQIQEKSFLLVL